MIFTFLLFFLNILYIEMNDELKTYSLFIVTGNLIVRVVGHRKDQFKNWLRLGDLVLE